MGVLSNAIRYADGLEYCSNCGPNFLAHFTNAVNVAGYVTWGSHSSLGNEYARNGTNTWSGESSWWLIATVESFNGWRGTGQGNFTQWFSQVGFGGTNYENAPIGAVCNSDEPYQATPGVDTSQYFGLWASGRTFAICAWSSPATPRFMAVGDPFVRR